MDINCAVFIDWGAVPTSSSDDNVALTLPCYPEELSEQLTPTWSSQNIVGRTGTLVAYTGTEDETFSFSMDLHREMEIKSLNSNPVPELSIDYLIKALKAACYPDYGNGNTLKAPVAMFQFGATIYCGRITSLGITKKGPIINDHHALYSVSVSMASVSTQIVDRNDVLA